MKVWHSSMAFLLKGPGRRTQPQTHAEVLVALQAAAQVALLVAVLVRQLVRTLRLLSKR